MLTLQDCIELSDLSEEEMLAVEMGNYLTHTPSGEKRIKRMIVDDIKHAKETGEVKHAAMLKSVLKHYVAEHKGAA